jgi:hypothetical protein
VEEAIRMLAEYVVFSIAIGARTHDARMLEALPSVLEPFAVLSPLLDAIHNNAVATHRGQCECHYEFARARWIEVLTKLDAATGTEMQHIEAISNAVAYAIGMMEAQLGMASATSWAERLDRDPYQKVSALRLRRIVRLEQGDWPGADRYRRQAEVLALQQRTPQMFNSLLAVELAACLMARDLSGIQQVIEHMRPLAARCEGWVPHLIDAEASFHLVRGDLVSAKAGFERCIELSRFGADGFSLATAMWVAAQAGLAETLLAMDRPEEARALASAALEVCDARKIGSHAFDIVRVLALAEAKLGDVHAAPRLDALIDKQLQLGVTGLRLGLSYEARAQTALWSGDESAFEQYARLTAREYRYGAHSPLGARYERLVNEASRRGFHASSNLVDVAPTALDSNSLASDDVHSVVMRSMARARRTEERASAALHLVCDARAANEGHLYLTSATGLVLSASRGGTPPESLAARVGEYLAREQTRSADMEEMATGELLEDDVDSSNVRISGVTYELYLLSCLVGAVGTVAGVAAVVTGEASLRSATQGQLLTVLAAHLLQTGDSTGVRFEG